MKNVLKNLVLVVVGGAVGALLLYAILPAPVAPLGGGGFDNIFQNSTISSVARIASTSTTVLAQTSARQYAKCTNMGPVRMDVAFGSTASRSWGMPIWASQSFSIDQNNLYLGIITARIPDDVASLSARISCIEK